MRAKIVQWLAKAFRLPYPYFELLPVSRREFNANPRDATGFPTVFDQHKFAQAVWPRPDRTYRVFVQPDE